VRAEKRPHEWLGGVLGVSGLAPSARTSQIKQNVLKGYTVYHIKQDIKYVNKFKDHVFNRYSVLHIC
jgi:hypothetical protein